MSIDPLCDNNDCSFNEDGDCSCPDLIMAIQQDSPPIVICKSVTPRESIEEDASN